MKNKFYTFKLYEKLPLDIMIKKCFNNLIYKLSNKYQKFGFNSDCLKVENIKRFESHDQHFCTVEVSGYDKLEELAATTGTPRLFRNAKKISLYIKLGREIKFENVKFEN